MKVRDCFELNPLKNKNTFKDFINYIDTSSVQNGTLINVSFLENEFPSRAQRIVEYNDILYSTVRPNLRHYYLYQDDFEHAVASTGFVLLRRKNNCNVKFIFYYLSTNEVVKHLSNIAEMSQSTFPSFSSKDLGKIDLPMIDEYKQKSIVDILACYDSLIENNNKRIKVLEQMAENLYKEWFVRFRFPGHENAEFENGIPKGWEIKRLMNFGRIETGKTPSTEVIENYGNDILFVKTPDMHGNTYVVDSEEKLSLIGNNTQPKKLLPPNSIMVTCIGSGGVVAINAVQAHTNQQINSIIIDDMRYLEWLYYTCKSLKSTIEMFGATGTTMTNLSKGKFEKLKVIKPPIELIVSFHNIVEPLLSKIKSLIYQNANLIKQRDLLLPRLMSGKLEV
ncbi:MAG: restriction endonuclease subunit S [Ruminococcus sp.]|nr:restriction endonuclease subunit S [Ruminococcus sp.]